MTGEKMAEEYVYAMDIGTRSIIGMVGRVENGKLCVIAIEKEEHSVRAMVDGQIEDIEQVAKVAASVKKKLEDTVGFTLDKVYVAAAGRALKTQKIEFEMELDSAETVTDDGLRNLEAGALALAEERFEAEEQEETDRRFYLVGYSISQYYLDHYPISNLLGHKGKLLGADLIATFLPSEVVESLYSSMLSAGMEVAGMTLEPIASMNAAIPQNLRLLNLVLVDIGAGTSDIASARDGSICGYTMATVAGDEITECLMKEYLIDFNTAEYLKITMGLKEELTYTDVLGFEHTITSEEIDKTIDEAVQSLCKRIAERILDVNGSVPSAVFLVGGGSKLAKVREYVAEYLEMDIKRVALGGNNFSIHAYSDLLDLKDPEYSTPLGIAVSAGLNLINDSFYIQLNDRRAKLFRSGRLTVRDVLMMNGYSYKDMMSRSGQSLVIEIDGRKKVLYGDYAVPAVLTVNDQPAGLSDMVKAGDRILFEAAINGKDASAVLADVVRLDCLGHVAWNGMEIPIGISAAVNGLSADADTPVTGSDRINVIRIYTVEDLLQHCGVDGPVLVNDELAVPDRDLVDGDMVSDAAIIKESPSAVTFTINGKPLSVEARKDKTPYYLMEMITHSGVDYTKPEGLITMKVNSEDAGFQTELTDGDNIEIYWS